MPLNPDQALQKINKISRMNGWSVAGFAGFCTFMALLIGDFVGVIVGSLVVVCGLMEVHGNRLLAHRSPDGMQWLIRSQLCLLGVLVMYSGRQMFRYRGDALVAEFSPATIDLLKQLEVTSKDIRSLVWLFYGAVIFTSCLYQGGLALYYSRRQSLVREALAAPPVI